MEFSRKKHLLHEEERCSFSHWFSEKAASREVCYLQISPGRPETLKLFQGIHKSLDSKYKLNKNERKENGPLSQAPDSFLQSQHQRNMKSKQETYTSRTRKPSEEQRVSPVGVLEEVDGRKLTHAAGWKRLLKASCASLQEVALRQSSLAIHCQNQQAAGRQSTAL